MTGRHRTRPPAPVDGPSPSSIASSTATRRDSSSAPRTRAEARALAEHRGRAGGLGGPTGPSTGLARSSAAMASGTFVSRITGFARSALLNGILGVGLTGSAFTIANNLPNQLYLLLAGGVLNAVLVPSIAKAARHDDGGDDFLNRLVTLALVLLTGVTLVATALAPLLVRLFASDKVPSQYLALATTFAFICLPQIFFYGLYALLGQILNARGRFAGYMWAPVVANIVMIGGLLYFLTRHLPRRADPDQWTPGMFLLVAGFATIGIIVQALVLLIPLRRSGFRYHPTWGFRGVGLGSASRMAIWTFAALAVSQLAFIVTSRVLTYADHQNQPGALLPSGLAAYTNAFLLFMLPHSLITLSVVTALFTRLSYAVHENRPQDVVADLGRGMRMPAVVLIPASVAGIAFAPWLTNAANPLNTVGETDTIAHIFTAMIAGLVPFGWFYLIQRVFYAYEDARTPFFLQLLVTGVATGVNLGCFALPGHLVGIGVGVGQTVSNLLGALVGFGMLRRRLGPLGLGSVIQQNVRLVLASLLGLVVCAPLLWVSKNVFGDGHLAVYATLAAVGALFGVLVLAAASRLGVREVRELLGPVLRRLPLAR